MRLGIVARCDKTGLGNQTLELTKMLEPHKVLLINSIPFNGNPQHPQWYDGYNVQHVRGFPTDAEVDQFLDGLDAVLTCEIPYNWHMFREAKKRGIRTVLQYNYEFLDYLNNPSLPLPDVLLSPSVWHLAEMQSRFQDQCEVVYLPPPTNPEPFEPIAHHNANKDCRRRYLHVVGKRAIHDRNGTDTLLRALKYLKLTGIEIVIKSQQELPRELLNQSKYKVTVDTSNPDNPSELYRDFDAVILPRKFGGLCLPMNEALCAGLPVIMTDVEPNDYLLPDEWLVPVTKNGEFMTRTNIDIYEADEMALAKKIDWLSTLGDDKLLEWKEHASNLAKWFSPAGLRGKYEAVLKGEPREDI